MLKKFLIIILFTMFLYTPVFAEAGRIQMPQQEEYDVFADDENESPEFEYPSSETLNASTKPNKDYASIYNNLKPADFAYMHDIDPDQYYDIKDTTWAPYPLLRLNSYIYFKNIAIEPGYYLITPREHKGNWYMLFKQNGKVSYIIPVYEREIVPETFYETHLAKPKLTPSQKMHMGFLSFLGKFDSSKRRDPIQSYMEINDLENYFVSIVIYYGAHKYSTVFRTIKL